jgi:hypothetical protein
VHYKNQAFKRCYLDNLLVVGIGGQPNVLKLRYLFRGEGVCDSTNIVI